MVGGGLDSTSHLGAALERQCGGTVGDALQLADEEAGLRRLVIADALPGHAVTVDMVVPQRRHAPRALVAGGIDAQGLVVAGAQDKLLAPVAEDVAEEARVILRRVVEGTA